jgi:cellulose synthase/poly-beta-1,6-N-acetylglucosamine synthase-like glycosyltransferase
MKDSLTLVAAVVSNVLQAYLLVTSVAYFLISLLAFLTRREKRAAAEPLKKFAVLVPAYNEENVIGFCVESLRHLDYPRELFDIVVVADHCNDGTARIAAEHGAVVYEHAGELRGKGFALEWATQRVLAEGRHDALCYFDADSLAHPDFLRAMSARLNEGAKAIQARQVAKNPDEAWLATMLAVGHVIASRFWQFPKYALGLSATLHGKGMCFTRELMAEHRWAGDCLTEDLDMQMQVIEGGTRIVWAEEALVYNEEPTTIRQFIKRSVRWARGGLQVARRHTMRLFRLAFSRRDAAALEAAIWCSLVYRVTMSWCALVLIYFARDRFQLLLWFGGHLPAVPLRIKLGLLVPLMQYPALALYWARAPWRFYVAYLLQPSLGIFRVPIYLWSVFNPPREWYRTEHNSRVGIRDLVRQK